MTKKLTLFTFIDAFGWEIYQRYGFLEGIIEDAHPLQTTFGFSSGADPSILTGRFPDEHTHWSCFNYNPEKSPFKAFKYLAHLPSAIFDRGRVRHWLSKVMAKVYGYTGYFEMYSVPFAHLPYFDYLEKRDYFVPGGIMATDTIFDWCVNQDIPYYCSNWRHSEPEILASNRAEIEKGETRFNYVYLPRLDGIMHQYGTNHPAVEKQINWLDQQIRSLYELALSQYDEVALYIISDHGMKDVTGDIDLIPDIQATGLEYGKDYVAMYDSTMARFWFMQPDAEAIIRGVLEGQTHGAIVEDDELKKMHVYFDDHRFGELFFLMEPGMLITPCYMGLKSIPGMHGYHPEDKDSYAMIAANKPITANVKSITDIRGIIEHELST
ncbi:alkaline phosphatase family protein [Shewanella sp.]|uniref:alkaline phosphatase family protein n=1 Tax=Shewanella sp. TaxID=50422 RepID=UPI001EBB8D58|nr:alkaline phosphatase family protein [Shewanella sp.]NRB22163.1 alkaline phosphatase family protein [Shewanella sp.]